MKIRSKTLLALAVLAFLIQYPVRTLVASVLSEMASRTLDDRTTDEFDMIPIDEESMPVYDKAIGLLTQAASWDGGNSTYLKAQADLYVWIGAWAEVTEEQGGKIPDGAFAAAANKERAEALLRSAIHLEPSKPDYHLALGQVYADRRAVGYADELERAAQRYPNSSPLRYEVAMQYLIHGDNVNALAHAIVLAARDDSYLLPDTAGSSVLKERRSKAYLSFLAQSYLAKAFEIAWRASDKDLSQIREMIPQGQEAKDTADLFLETKRNSVIDDPK